MDEGEGEGGDHDNKMVISDAVVEGLTVSVVSAPDGNASSGTAGDVGGDTEAEASLPPVT